MPENLREMFDVMTFYKPVGIVVEEQRSLFMSVMLLVVVTVGYWLIASVLSAFASQSDIITQFITRSVAFFALFFIILFQVPLSSLAVFFVSRLFSSKGDLIKLMALNFFLVASAGLLMFVVMIPFAEFAGAVFLIIGGAIYLYFTNEVFEKMFGVPHFQSIILLIFYFGVPLVFAGLAFLVTGQLQVLVE